VQPSALWTDEENQLLTSLVAGQQQPDWRAFASFFPTKTSHQLLDRWLKVLDPNLVKGNWTAEEDQKILAWVRTHGTNSWAQLALGLPGRIGKQVRERYHNSLDPAVNKSDWSPAEDNVLVQMHGQLGNKWSKIAEVLPGRTDNAIKNRWNATLKKRFADTGGDAEVNLPNPVNQEIDDNTFDLFD
jgi:hypothetical protein